MNGKLNSRIFEGLSSTSQIQKASNCTLGLTILAAPKMRLAEC